jgi:hypothetical protein
VELLSTPDLYNALQDVITQYWNNPGMPVETFVEKFAGAMQAAG